MNLNKKEVRIKRKHHIRKNIFGDKNTPRVSIFKSNSNFYAQAIDDQIGVTLTESSTLKMADLKNKSNMSAVKLVADNFILKLKEKGINKIVFDRNGYIYHGKVKYFADILRKEGIKF